MRLLVVIIRVINRPMAFVIQRPKTKTYTAVWKGPDGKQVRRVTGETSKRAAQAKANEWEIEDKKRAGDNHETHRAAFAILDQAARDLRSGHLNLRRAEELLRRLHLLADPKANGRMSALPRSRATGTMWRS